MVLFNSEMTAVRGAEGVEGRSAESDAARSIAAPKEEGEDALVGPAVAVAVAAAGVPKSDWICATRACALAIPDTATLIGVLSFVVSHSLRPPVGQR